MIVTEKEAKTKRCQEGFGPLATGIADSAGCAPLNCIGSACMAWRWAWQEGVVGALGEKPVHLCTDFGTTPLGYCGKAGKP